MSWYNTSWNYRIKITVDHAKVDSNLTDYPVYVDLSNLPSDFFTNVKTDGADIRITKSDGTTELPREVVAISTSGSTGELHFKADSLSSTIDTDFYIYYGNSSATEPASNATYGSENVWSSAFKLVTHLETNFTDSTSLNNNGINNGTTDIAGKLSGRGRQFASGNYIDFGNNTSLDITNGMSLSGWYYSTSSSLYRTFMNRGYNENGDYYYGLYNNNQKLQIWCDGTNHYNSGANDVSNNTWHHIAFEMQTGTNGLQLFVDGVLYQQWTTSKDLAGSSVYHLRAGYDDRDENYPFIGQMDELRKANAIRGIGWWTTEYNNQSSPATFYTVGSQESNSPTFYPLPSFFRL